MRAAKYLVNLRILAFAAGQCDKHTNLMCELLYMNLCVVPYFICNKEVEHVICDDIVCHFINIVAAAILQILSTSMIQFSSALCLVQR